MRIGFIGLGTMGNWMALNLQKAGYDLVVHDIRRDCAKPHIEAGAIWADSPSELARDVDVIFTSLPGPREMEAVGLGDQGLLTSMRTGTAWFDLSTNSPTVIRRVFEHFAKKGIDLLDAPVSGGLKGARSGKLALYVGGNKMVYDRHKKLLDAIGDQVMYVGPIGSGTLAKLAHNCASFIVKGAIAEVFSLGVKAGVEPLALWHAIRQGSSGRRRTFDGIDQFLQDKYEPASFMLKLAHKDMMLATELARELNVPMRLADIRFSDLTEALNRGWGNLDARSAMKLQLERAGVEIHESAESIKKIEDLG
jgi:3-hydroxyisobutyrate dehydrogenase